EERRAAELLRHGQHPLDQALELGPSGANLERVEVDQLSREAVANRPPEVLLDPAVGPLGESLPLVVGPGDTRAQRVPERRERLRLRELGLAVTDPDLDRRKGEMRPNAPPDLRVLVNRSRLVQPAYVLLEPGPARVGVRDSAAREHPREDLGAGRMQAAVDALHERGAGGQRQQVRQPLTHAVADGDRAVRPLNGHVDVEAERVVAPDDVSEQRVVPPVVGGVDDPLLLPWAPGVRPGRAQFDAESVSESPELGPSLADPGRGLREGRASSGTDLDLGRDQLADQMRLELGAPRPLLELPETIHERERVRAEGRELVLD